MQPVNDLSYLLPFILITFAAFLKPIKMSDSSQKNKFTGFSSAAIHAGHKTGENYAHLTPIYASSTYVFDTAEQGMNRFNGTEEGFIYSRWGNPIFEEAENKIAALEAFGISHDGKPLQLKSILPEE